MKLFRMSALLALPAIWAQPVSKDPLHGIRLGKAARLYVSATNGNDAWSGRFPQPIGNGTDGPLATFDQARQTVQAMDKSGLAEVDVLFHGGTYYLPDTLQFGLADSGTPDMEIVYENFPGESPVFSGGMRVSNWTNVGGNQWQATLPPGTANFDNLYYNGTRRLRPRVGGYLGRYFRIFKTVYLDHKYPGCPHQNMDQNDQHYQLFECFDRFRYDPNPLDDNNPFADPWTNLVLAPNNQCQPGAGDPALWCDIQVLVFEQFSTSKLPVSCVDPATHTVYLTAPTPSPGGDHASEAGFIEGNRYLVENVKNALTQPGQWYLDRRTTPQHPQWTLTYLANPGEDPNRDDVIVPQVKQLLVASNLSYVTFSGLTFEHDNYAVPFPQGHPSVALEPDISAALSFQNSNHITFTGGTVRLIAGTGLGFLSCIDPTDDSSTDPAAECRATLPGPDVSHNTITGSAFYDIGALAIRIGEPYLSTDGDLTVPYATTVENNVVVGYGRTIPSSFGIAQGFGHDNTYTHNDVYDGYHVAISIAANAGEGPVNGVGEANNTISFNHVHDIMQGISNDGGAVRIESGNAAYAAPGNRILNNKIHDITDASIMDANGYGGHGIYMDNETGRVDVENNLVYRVSHSAVYTPHGPTLKPGNPDEHNLIKNNILAYARLGMVEEGNPFSDANPVPAHRGKVVKSFVLTNNIFYFDRNLFSTSPFQNTVVQAPFIIPAGCAYTPFEYSLYQEFDNNVYWRTDGMFAADTSAFIVQTTPQPGPNGPCAGSRFVHRDFYTFSTFAGWTNIVGEDQHSVVAEPHFANPHYPADDFRLLGGWLGIDFSPFDPNDAGRYRNGPQIQPPAVAATFLTATYNPATDF